MQKASMLDLPLPLALSLEGAPETPQGNHCIARSMEGVGVRERRKHTY